jgi:hypothetical protein
MGFKDAANNFDFSLREIFANMHVAMVMPFSTIVGKSNLPSTSKLDAAAFLGKTLAYNALASTAQAVTPYLEALVAEALFVMGKYYYYKFLLNPTNVNFGHSKLQSIEETSDLTIINTYRNTATTLTFKGVSGCTLPREFMTLMNTTNALPKETLTRYPKLSSAWIKFRQLEKFYTEINSDIVLMYDMDLYVGKFVSLNYTLDANNPWIINYDMSFKLYPGLSLHTLSVYDYKSFFSSMVDRYGKTFATDFEGKSKKAPA